MIREILWPHDRTEHIANHGIRPYEVEEVCFTHPLVLRGRTEGPNPVYYVLGQTRAGRHLFCVIIQFADGKGYPVTARPMTRNERKRYNRSRNR